MNFSQIGFKKSNLNKNTRSIDPYDLQSNGQRGKLNQSVQEFEKYRYVPEY